LSYLEEDYQYVVLNKLQYDEVSPSLGQAITLKKMQQEGTISEEKIENLLDKEKPNQKEFIKIHNERIDKYIPNKIKESGKVEDFIIQCVEEHNKRERLKQERNTR
jgi:ParB family chromosome partitioning protein